MQLDPENEWIRLAHAIPWDRMEVRYAALFPSRTGYPATPLRIALGILTIQKRKKLSDRAVNKSFHPWDESRTYRKVARKEYLVLAKSKKRTEKKIRATIRKQLECVRRDLGYLERYMGEGYRRFVVSWIFEIEIS